MKKTVILIIVLAVIAMWGVSQYNGLVTSQESANTAWSNVENQYQRRADLIPNLVNTVKGYAEHEKGTFEAVVEARSKATSIKIDANNLTEEKLKEFQAAQGDVTNALSRLIAISENYPELKANENFKELQAQLEGTENRIAIERRNFNETARTYNTTIRQFPRNIIAGICGFNARPYFEAAEGNEKAPEVKF